MTPSHRAPRTRAAATVLWHVGKDACSVVAHAMRRYAAARQRLRESRAGLRAQRDLYAMSDYQLRDLGVDRSELRSITLDPHDATRARIDPCA